MSMKVKSFYKSMMRNTVAWWQDISTMYRLAVVAGLLVLGVAGGYGGYRWYKITVETSAQKSFSDCMYVYKEALNRSIQPSTQEQEKQGKNLWEEAEIAFKLAYQQHTHSDLAPFFLAFQSDALMHQGKTPEALELLDTAINKIGKKSPYNALYRIKRALIQIDNEALRSNGLQELEKLKNEKNNKFKDMTLFYLGSYFWSMNDLDQARSIWQQLIDEFGTDTEGPGVSPWVNQAKAVLGNNE